MRPCMETSGKVKDDLLHIIHAVHVRLLTYVKMASVKSGITAVNQNKSKCFIFWETCQPDTMYVPTYVRKIVEKSFLHRFRQRQTQNFCILQVTKFYLGTNKHSFFGVKTGQYFERLKKFEKFFSSLKKIFFSKLRVKSFFCCCTWRP
jgi:hypothetical protein